MNQKLYSLHRMFFFAYGVFAVLLALIGVTAFFGTHREDAGVGLVAFLALPFAAIHYYAAVGAKTGQEWGKSASRLIATIMLIGFPIGTVIGVYIFRQTGKKWESSASTGREQ